MDKENQILFHNKYYNIIQCENECLVHPSFFQIDLLSSDKNNNSLIGIYKITEYHLFLEELRVERDGSDADTSEEIYSFSNLNIPYTGAILLANEVVKEYFLRKSDQLECFSYKYVYELILKDGILITTIDHSKAMQRIRKNLELNLRSLEKKRDIRCIVRFIKTTFIGNYKNFSSSKKRNKYIDKMKKQYLKKDVSFSLKN